jgi:hypothetical protein
MSVTQTRFVLCAMVAAAGIVTGAAAPSSQAMPPQPPPSWAAQSSTQHSITASDVIYQAAPVPNPDASGPPDTSKPQTQLGPTFISSSSLFKGDGDGYAYASSADATLDGRRRAAAGVGLSVPLADK